MAEQGCLQDAVFNNVEVKNITVSGANTLTGNMTVEGGLSAKLFAHMTGQYRFVPGLATTAIAATATAITAPEADTVYSSSWISAAPLTITLPTAVPGRLVQYEQATTTAIAGTTNALTFSVNGNDTFDTTKIVALSDGLIRGMSANLFTASPGAAGGVFESWVNSVDTAAAGDNNFLYTPATTNNNWGGPGSMFSFYCATAGSWIVGVPVTVNEVATSTGANGVLSFT